MIHDATCYQALARATNAGVCGSGRGSAVLYGPVPEAPHRGVGGRTIGPSEFAALVKSIERLLAERPREDAWRGIVLSIL